ncbi:MAG: OsmC family protein [Sphingomonadales bacterium]|nr:OsmC family protein [Sphingomonadales bacterium]
MDRQSEIVKRSDDPQPTSFAVTPFRKARPGEAWSFEVNVVAEPLDGMEKRATIGANVPGVQSFELISDESPAIGGENRGPAPLVYMAGGIAFCFLTHASFYIKARQLNVEHLRVELRMRFSTRDKTASGDDTDPQCLGIETHVAIDSPESREEIHRLIADAEAACLAMKAIINATPAEIHLHHDGQTTRLET